MPLDSRSKTGRCHPQRRRVLPRSDHQSLDLAVGGPPNASLQACLKGAIWSLGFGASLELGTWSLEPYEGFDSVWPTYGTRRFFTRGGRQDEQDRAGGGERI